MYETHDLHREMLEDLRHCPKLTDTADNRARQADYDARRLIADIRDLDPRQIWGRLNKWGQRNPQRLIAAFVSTLAYADPDDVTTGQPPAWTRNLGGTAALHPDYVDPRSAPAQNSTTAGDVTVDRGAIVRLRMAGTGPAAIALRLGLSLSKVESVCRETGLTKGPTDIAARDAEIAELAKRSHKSEIAKRLGLHQRTVERAIARARKAADAEAAA